MIKRIVILTGVLLIGGFLTASLPVTEVHAASAENDRTHSGMSKDVLSVPGRVISLGVARDPQSGTLVEGYAIVRPREVEKKPTGTPGPTGGTSSCYAFIAKGAKWKNVEDWVIDPSNDEGLDEGTVFSLIHNGVTKWEDAADGIVDAVAHTDIIGNGALSTGFTEAGVLDGVNGVRFGDLDPGTIGVTVVWGTFSGPVGGRSLVEWDQVYNTDFAWSTSSDANSMDFDSIATHELGHTFGLADLYQSECSAETMYGYGSEGQIYARSLNSGDILGISTLY